MNDTSRIEIYQNLASHSELALFQINSDHQLTFTSQPFERLLNWDDGELEGHLVAELAHPENVQGLPEQLKNAALPKDESTATIAIKFQHKTKGWILCELRCIAVDTVTGKRTFLVTTASDADDQTNDKAIIELTQKLCSQNHLAAVVDESSNTYLWSNQNYLDLIGLTQTELNGLYQQGSHEEPLLTPENQQTAATLKELLSQNPATESQLISFTDSNGASHAHTFNVLSCKFGSKTYLIGHASDSTVSTGQIPVASKTHQGDIVERMVGDIAHSFNNLLSIVSGHAAILEESAGLENNSSFESIQQAVTDGASLIKQLNSLSLTKTHEPETLNLGHYIEQMQTMLKLAIGKSINLSIVNNNDNWLCSISPADYEYALIELCINAKETMSTGSTLNITIEQVSPPSEDIKTYSLVAADYTKLAIVESDSDVPAETAQRMFSPFLSMRENSSTNPEDTTTQGSYPSSCDTVFVVSTDKTGSTGLNAFIPRDIPNEDALGRDPTPIVFESKIKRALLLEDDQGVRELVSMFLQGQGFDVTEAESGNEVDRLEDLNFDIMVSDVMLPGKEMGPQVVRKIRASVNNLPVLFISGYSHGALNSEDLTKPNTDFLAKPFSKSEFVTKIEQLLAQQSK